MRRIAITAVIGLTLCVPAQAAGPDGSFSTVADSFLGGIVQEKDVGLVFGYLREALEAAAEGREAPSPERLIDRAEAMSEEMKRRGVVAGRAILDAIESSVRDILKEPPRLPPSSVLQPIRY